MLKELKQKIYKLLPDLRKRIVTGTDLDSSANDYNNHSYSYKEIGIAEVLRALNELCSINFPSNKELKYVVAENGNILELVKNVEGDGTGLMTYKATSIFWNLKEDNINTEEEETIKWLNSILK